MRSLRRSLRTKENLFLTKAVANHKEALRVEGFLREPRENYLTNPRTASDSLTRGKANPFE